MLPPLSIPKIMSHLHGTIHLDGSKSISNRALIMMALADAEATQYLTGLSHSKDTQTLLRLLSQRHTQTVFDAGDAGTVFRFMAAFLATQPGEQVLTGSARMKERPVGPLVGALKELGADIEFLEKEGYPPLRIGAPAALGTGTAELRINAGVSSQFLSAIMMIAPYLPGGIRLVPEGNMVSRSYIDLTLHLMRQMGAGAGWEGEHIVVRPGGYVPRPLRIEADWSAASYWYSFVAIADSAEIRLNGLGADSAQGDAVLPEMMKTFGVTTEFDEQGIIIRKTGPARPFFEWNFVNCPDIAQTLAVTCAATGTQGLFTGLDTLSIKETDRIAALKHELGKVGVSFVRLPSHFNKKKTDAVWYMAEGKAHWEPPVSIATYGDHRMAMSFAPLSLLGDIKIEAPDVVKKSYPAFWKDVEAVVKES